MDFTYTRKHSKPIYSLKERIGKKLLNKINEAETLINETSMNIGALNSISKEIDLTKFKIPQNSIEKNLWFNNIFTKSLISKKEKLQINLELERKRASSLMRSNNAIAKKEKLKLYNIHKDNKDKIRKIIQKNFKEKLNQRKISNLKYIKTSASINEDKLNYSKNQDKIIDTLNTSFPLKKWASCKDKMREYDLKYRNSKVDNPKFRLNLNNLQTSESNTTYNKTEYFTELPQMLKTTNNTTYINTNNYRSNIKNENEAKTYRNNQNKISSIFMTENSIDYNTNRDSYPSYRDNRDDRNQRDNIYNYYTNRESNEKNFSNFENEYATDYQNYLNKNLNVNKRRVLNMWYYSVIAYIST